MSSTAEAVPLTLCPLFLRWVANTVHAISGIYPEHPCGLASKPVLTFTESRIDACQAFSFYTNQALSRDLSSFCETSWTLH